MFFRVVEHKTKNKCYKHLQLVETFRDPEKGKSPRTRILYNFGPLEDLSQEQRARLAAGFLKATGQDAQVPEFLEAKDYGHVYAAQAVWDKLGFSQALIRAGISGKAKPAVCGMLRWMVVNRLCEPCSKLALLDWMESVWAPEVGLSYHALLRAMDRLITVKEKAEPLLANALLGKNALVDMVFYDITSSYFEGDKSVTDDDIRRYGYSRDHREDRRQVVIGMVVTRDGIPLCHHVFAGNTADKTTVARVIGDLKARFNLQRIIFVGDRGMLSDANLTQILNEDLGFIVAHPVRGNETAERVIREQRKRISNSADEQFFEDTRSGIRFIMAFSPKIAEESRRIRQERLDRADAWLQPVLDRLVEPPARGRRATPQGAYDRIRDYLRDHNLLKFYRISLVGEALVVKKHLKALHWEEAVDGILLLETTDMALPAQDIVRHYKELAEIERAWRSLKSTLRVRPVYHWTERRIRAHIFLCVMALQLERWMRGKLSGLSVAKAMHTLRQIKVGRLSLGGQGTTMTTTLTSDQKEILKKLGIGTLNKDFGKTVCSMKP
jgi:transposase